MMLCARRGSTLALAALGILALPRIAGGNPLPEAAIFVHVQPAAPGAPPLADCAQLVQYTSETGELQFDLYLKCFICEPGYPLSALALEFTWNPAWTWLGYELPAGAAGSVSVVGNQASANLSWPDCPPVAGEVALVLRCFLNVTGEARFPAGGGDASVLTGCPPNTALVVAWLQPARAGVLCSYCWADCDFGALCAPNTATPLLTLAVPQGELISETVDFSVYGGYWPCPLQGSGSEPWMQVTTESLGEEGDYRVTLGVDTGLLEPGHYSGWLRGESDCVACTRVELEVLLPTGVPAGPPAPSLGRIKAYY